MASKHGHGYKSTYVGADRSAGEQFSRLTDLSQELQTSYGQIVTNILVINPAGAAFVNCGFNVPILTSTYLIPGVLEGSRDVYHSAPGILQVRYGGMYRVRWQGFWLADVAGQPILQIFVNGVGQASTNTVITVNNVAPVFAGFEFYVLANDGDSIELRIRRGSIPAPNAIYCDAGGGLSLIGNRL